MATAFTYDVTTNRGQVRLKLGDTREATAWFDDAEIDQLITIGGSVNGAVVEGARVLLADRARRGRSYSDASGLSYDDTAQVAALQALIAEYGGATKTYPAASIVEAANLPMDHGYDELDP